MAFKYNLDSMVYFVLSINFFLYLMMDCLILFGVMQIFAIIPNCLSWMSLFVINAKDARLLILVNISDYEICCVGNSCGCIIVLSSPKVMCAARSISKLLKVVVYSCTNLNLT